MNSYIQEHYDKTYVFTDKAIRIFYKNYDDVFNAPYIPDNTVRFVGWAVGSSYYLDQLEEHNIPHLYIEMIDNDNVSFVLDNKSKEFVVLFYNEHYAKQNDKIALKAEKEFHGYAIYNVIRESK